MRLDVVAGAQYGSEAKGHMVQALAQQRVGEPLRVIRVAGPNAGHTGYDPSGKAWALRQVPVAAVVPGTMTLEIAAGSEIDLPVLIKELRDLRDAGLLDGKRVLVHPEATLIEDRHKDLESGMSERLGSTAKGIGAARADRIMRLAKRLVDVDYAVNELNRLGVEVARPLGNYSENTIVEGTQGYALGLHAGRYPYCTSSNTRAIDFMAMAGVHPWEYEEFQIWLVARVFPIRVAGNSGPMKGETTWADLGVAPEYTTVTKKERRVGSEDWDLVAEAVAANGGPGGPVRLGLFMLDQKFPEVAGSTEWYHLPLDAEDYLSKVEDLAGAEIGLVGTGPQTHVWRNER